MIYIIENLFQVVFWSLSKRQFIYFSQYYAVVTVIFPMKKLKQREIKKHKKESAWYYASYYEGSDG